jgi:hypothetical protein
MTKQHFLPLLLVAACDAQVDSDHQGEVLATLSGTMRTSTDRTHAEADVSVVWTVGSGGRSFVGADAASVEGMLPSNFTLSVFTIPGDHVMSEWDGVKFAAGHIVAAPMGVDAEQWQQWYGVDNNRVIVYVPVTPPPGSVVAGVLKGSPAPGYHLYDVKRLTQAEVQEKYDCITKFAHENHREPTRAEILSICGGDGHDELLPARHDLDTPLDIEIVDEFGLDQFNALPSWFGI